MIRATILGCGSSGGVPRLGGHWGECNPENPRNRRRRCSLLLERTGPQGTTTPAQQDEDYQFIDRIARSNNDVWTSIFQQAGRTYTPPKTVLYSGAAS